MLRSVAAALAGLFGAAAFAAEAPPKEGQKAPDFKLTAASGIEKALPGKKKGDEVSLKDLHGKNVVLFFYPKAMTRGCTIESCGFRDVQEKLAGLDTVVVGISTDNLEDQQK